MGRKLIEIRRFDKGMAGYIDGEDSDPEVGALALNIDPESPMGMIRGLPARREASTFAGALNPFIRMKIMEKRDGTNVLVGIEEGSGEVGVVEDYLGAASYTPLGTAAMADKSTVALSNNQAYIGLGSDPAHHPQWVGEIAHDQFGVAQAGGYQMDRAEIEPPKQFGFRSNTNIKPAGTPATTLAVTTGDPTQLPEKGLLMVPYRANGGPNDGNLDTSLVSYSSRDANGFYGISWIDTDVFAIPSDYTIGDDGLHDEITYSEVSFRTATYNAGGDEFINNKAYCVAASYVYDGYKETPLTILKRGALLCGAIVNDDETDYGKYLLYMHLQGFFGTRTMSKRITGVCLYIAPFEDLDASGLAQTTGGGSAPGGQEASFRLAVDYDLTTTDFASETVTIAADDVAYGLEFERASYAGPTYFDNSGQSEAIETSALHYGMGVTLNNELFVSDIYNPSAPTEDWRNYLCKSEPLQFEVFDWVNNYLVLPRPITAIAEFSGRIYAFDKFTMYRINPQQLYIEDTYEGVGALNADSVITTEYGLFIASYHDVYRFDGKQLSRISEPVAEIEAVDGYQKYGYRYFVQTQIPNNSSEYIRLSFDSEKRCLVIYGYDGTEALFWLFRIDKGTWRVAEGQQAKAHCFSHQNSIITSGATPNALYEEFRGSRMDWVWISKKLAVGSVSQPKKFRKVETKGDAIALSYRIDSAGAFQAIANLDSSQPSSKGQWIQLKLEGTGAEECNAVSVLFRDKGGYPA